MDSPHHNSRHAADVTQGMYYLITFGEYEYMSVGHRSAPNAGPDPRFCRGSDPEYTIFSGGLHDIVKCNKMEIMAILLATACHDVGHPGVNNKFLCATHDKTAIQVMALGFLVVCISDSIMRPLLIRVRNSLAQFMYCC